MKYLYLSFLISIGSSLQAQIINIPDANFKNALVNTLCVDFDNNGVFENDVDTNNDGEIQLSEALAIHWSLQIANRSISSLEGIQYFTNLDRLYCVDNNLTQIDVSALSQLVTLNCGFNALTQLDVSQNTNLKNLYCYRNGLFNIDVSNNLNLEELNAAYNNLVQLQVTDNPNLKLLEFTENYVTQIDVTQNPNLDHLRFDHNRVLDLNVSENPNLRVLWVDHNRLRSLNLENGNNPHLDVLETRHNPNLLCLLVDDVNYANSRPCLVSNFTWCKDEHTEYSTECIFSIDDFESRHISIYPNPVRHTLQISAHADFDIIQIYSLSGTLLKQSSNSQIGISEFPSGIYFALISKGAKSVTKKFIKY